MTKPPYQINSSLRKNYPAHHPQEGGGTEDEVIPISRGGTGATTAQGARNNLGTNDASNLTTGTLPNDRVSNSLPRNKAYRQGNILGTVAQSGGAPTGAIIERGSNANGEYVRYADGTQICWFESNSETTSSSQASSNNNYCFGPALTYPFAASFSITPKITTYYIGVSQNPIGAEQRSGTSTNAVVIRLIGMTTLSKARLGYVAIGRWF